MERRMRRNKKTYGLFMKIVSTYKIALEIKTKLKNKKTSNYHEEGREKGVERIQEEDDRDLYA